MKVIPIKVERTPPLPYTVVEWKIHNVCNYNCSFCGLPSKDGSVRWLNIETYKSHIDKITNLCKDIPLKIQITGGEPTLFPDLIELLKYIKTKNAEVSLISNASRTLRYWEEVRNSGALDILFLTYHSEQTDNFEHIAEIVNLFHGEKTEVIILITHTIFTFDKAVKAQKYFKENTGVIIGLKAMVVGDYDIYSLYTQEQLNELKQLSWQTGNKRKTKVRNGLNAYEPYHHFKIEYSNGETKIVEAQDLLKNNYNKFYGWNCHIGESSFRIDSEIIYRGVCGVGETQNLNQSQIKFFENPVFCDKPICVCTTDLLAKKTLPNSM